MISKFLKKLSGSGDDPEFVTIRIFGNSADAALAVGFLESKGIKSRFLADRFGQATLEVPKANLIAASNALDSSPFQPNQGPSLPDEEEPTFDDDSHDPQTTTTRRVKLSKAEIIVVRTIALLFLMGFGSWVFSSIEFVLIVSVCVLGLFTITRPIFRRGAIPFLATCVLPTFWLTAIDGLSGVKKWLVVLDWCIWFSLLPLIRGWLPRSKAIFEDWQFKTQVVRAGQYCLLAWLTLSMANRLFPREPIPVDSTRNEKLVQSSAAHRNIGLALSGGGYRAAIFHAGVLSALERFGLTPTHLSSVSGGSIIASFYVMGGDPNAFPQFVKEGRFRLLRRLTYADQALTVIPSFLSTKWSLGGRTKAQAALLDDTFLRNTTIDDLRGRSAPKWIICTTDLLHGWGIGIFDEGMIIHPLLREGERLAFRNAPLKKDSDRPVLMRRGEEKISSPVASLVAASGAFPIAFDAVRVTFRGVPLLLSDGGVSDNTGLSLLLDAHLLSTGPVVRGIADPELEEFMQLFTDTGQKPLESWKLDAVISSDAGLPLTEKNSASFTSQLGQALDTLFANGSLPPVLAAKAPPSVILSPADLVNHDFTPTQDSILVKLPGNPTSDEIAAIFVTARASGISRKKRIVELALTLSPEAKTFIKDTLLVDNKDEAFGIAGSRIQQIEMILYKLHEQGALKERDSVDVDFLQKVVFATETYVNSFMSTGTLQDNISDNSVDNIFRLGQLAVALNTQALLSAVK
jgi:predicted acylesterase/phospholipase RssA